MEGYRIVYKRRPFRCPYCNNAEYLTAPYNEIECPNCLGMMKCEYPFPLFDIVPDDSLMESNISDK